MGVTGRCGWIYGASGRKVGAVNVSKIHVKN